MHLSILLATTSCVCVCVLAKPLVVDPRYNIAYHGLTTSPGIESFLGISYGVPPIGELRFAPPEPFYPALGTTVNATATGHSCPQAPGSGGGYQSVVTDISEDCLNLIVARPKGVEMGSGVPVMVYIYGGGLNEGTAYPRTGVPDGLIKEAVEGKTPVIYVAMNYRLSVFGFATAESLRADKSLNVGLKDQRLALEWVRENIRLFGGDPERVTIFGQSSGGLSVGMQVLAYGASKPVPFQAAIMQSTALEPGMATNISFNATSAIAVAAGCNATDAYSTSPALIACLRSLSMEKLLNLTSSFITETSSDNDGDIFLPTVDQDFLPKLASKLVADGKFPKIPYMAGWQENDATLFTDRTVKTPNDTRAFVELYYPFLTSTTLTNLLNLYPVTDFQANTTADLSAEFYRTAQIFRDILLTCPSVYFGAAMAKKYSGSSEVPVYLYVGNQTILDAYQDAKNNSGLGVIHTSELPYLYGNLSIYNVTVPGYTYGPTANDFALAKSLPRTWAAFATTGRPGGGKGTLEGWESAFPGGEGPGDVFVVGGGDQGMVGAGAERLGERCGFLNSEVVVGQLMY